MQYRTKKQRLCALPDAWMKLHKKTVFTTRAVSEWAVANGFFPVPKRGDPEADCMAWETRLTEAGR